jgi:hypothetical protein
MHFGSVLTNEDIAADDIFSAEFLDTEALPWLSRPLRDDPPPFFWAISLLRYD